MQDIELNIHKREDSDNLSSSSSHKDYNKSSSFSKEEKREYIKNIIKRFDLLKKRHAYAYQYYMNLHYALSIPIVLLGGATSILSFLNTNYEGESTATDINIAIGVVSSIITIGNTISSSMNYKTKAMEHNVASKEYSRLITESNTELILLNDNQFIQYIETEELKIKSNLSSVLPYWIEGKIN